MTALEAEETEHTIDELLARLEPRLRRIMGRYQVPAEDADDILQQTLLDFVYKEELINNPEGWLMGSVRNRCVIYWRKRRRRLYESVDAAILELLARPERPDQDRAVLRRDLERVLGELSPRCQDVLRLRYGLGYGPTEVAEKLGYRPSSIRKVTNRCLARLTRQLVAIGYPSSSKKKSD